MTLRCTTAGESHGRGLVAIVEGIPAGLRLDAAHIDADLARRMTGHGRGGRMRIEADAVEWLAGVRAGDTIGSPIAMLIANRDWDTWRDVMAPEADPPGVTRGRAVTRPRPGHADLTGVLKYDRHDARDVLERASARETAARTACGAVCRVLLAEFGIEIGSHVVELGGVAARPPDPLPAPLNPRSDRSPVRCLDPAAEREMIARIDAAHAAGDTLGGVAEVVTCGLPVGLGSYSAWDRRIDGRLAQALMSIPAVKGVEIGLGFAAARLPGSAVHDEILPGMTRASNRAGGTEGGMTTGEPLVARVAMKPIATLMSPLRTVSLETGEPAAAQAERSDVTAVPAMGVVAEAMTAIILAQALLEQFGGDSLTDLRRHVSGYQDRLRARRAGAAP